MALYWLCAKYVSRRQGRSFAGALSYRSGQKLYCAYDGLTHDYRYRSDIVHAEILLPEYAPQEYLDFQTFSNAVELAEKREDARTAREIIIALPRELATTTNITLVRDFVKNYFVEKGMCAAVAVHRGDNKKAVCIESDHMKVHQHNPHAHILLSTRPVGPNGFDYKKIRDWDKREYLMAWRKGWADIQNQFLARKGLEARVSHESYEKQGIDRETTFHLGPVLSAMERRGIRTRLGNKNRTIEKRNQEREGLDQQHQLDHDYGPELGWSK